MAQFRLYFTCCALLLLMNWRTSRALPLPDPSASGAQCAPLFRGLLTNITDLLQTEDLCLHFITSSEVTIPSAETVQACAPAQSSGCMRQRDSSFSESECRRSIALDLAFYDAAIRSYLQSQLHRPDKEETLLGPVLRTIRDLREDCATTASGDKDPTEEEAADMWKNDSFTNRQKMCKMMRGFHVRAITINRAMGYISSGDHRK
ncbi:interleukin-12 subunit alpha [Nematolebias whitei]|uniref:interleukin-12 subunit alpha n=1 Tax=Nematolebias whitei TaxID=451745 RepID=UPI00189910D3|nr:interleukin-12 subunit alpha [Nematolebias whitei]